MSTILKCCRVVLAFVFVVAMFSLSVPNNARAADPKSYVALPDGTTGVLFYSYHRTADNQYRDGKRVNSNADYDMNLQILRPVYYKEVGGYMTSVQALLPYGNVSVGSNNTVGTADPTLIVGFWPVADKSSKTWFAIAEYITAPWGRYDERRPLNMGANRWGFRTEASLAKGFGKFFIDLTPSVEFYTDNSDYLYGGNYGRNLSTEPLYRMETHLTYDFTEKFMLSLGHYYERGGINETDGVRYGKRDNHAVQLTAGIRFAPKHQLLLQYLEDVKIENGFKRSQIGLRYFYVF